MLKCLDTVEVAMPSISVISQTHSERLCSSFKIRNLLGSDRALKSLVFLLTMFHFVI